MTKTDIEYFAIFGGGGIRGISYCGAYKALLDNNIKLTGYAGSSIGAVFTSLLAVGYNHDEIYEILANTGFEMFTDINIDFKKELALSKGKIFYEWIKDKIEQKFYGENYRKGEMEPVRFCDLDKKLIIFSVDLTNIKFKEFSFAKTPNFEIASAVRASVSMPGLFTPLEYEGNLIVDGDLLKSMPLWRVTNSIKDLDERILEFRLEDNENAKKVTNSLEYLNRVYNAISGFATDYIVDMYKQKDKFDYIKINTENISVVDFLLPKPKRKELYDTGYQKTDEYFKNFYPVKKALLLNKYEKLYDYVSAFEKEFKRTNIVNSYLKLCEIFMYLCEEKVYIDSKLYDLIIELKNEYTKNCKKASIFGFLTISISNKEEISQLILNIIKKLALKIDELKN